MIIWLLCLFVQLISAISELYISFGMLERDFHYYFIGIVYILQMEKLIQLISLVFTNAKRREMSKAFQKLKIAMIKKTLAASKINYVFETPQNTNKMNLYNSYSSILPEENYTECLKNTYNHQAEKKLSINDAINYFENRTQKQSYFEGHLNRTQKQILEVQLFPRSIFIQKSIHDHHPSALQLIKNTDYLSFFESLLAQRKNWGTWQTPAHRLNYKTSMKSPLTNLKYEDSHKAIEIFTQLAYMEMMSINRPRHRYTAMIVNKVIGMEDEFREEIFLQIIKQMNGKHSQYLPWFILFYSAIKVSLRMYAPLLNYIYSNVKKF